MTGVTGKVVLITGAARGIGAATAKKLSTQGAKVALVGLEPHNLELVAKDCGDNAAWWEADVTNSAELEAAVKGVVERFGRIDIAMANAGIANFGTIKSATVEEFARTIDINLTGVYRTAAATAPELIKTRGYLLLVASVASFVPLPGGAAYAASKAGVDSLAASLRLELHRDGVMVGSAHPSWIDTDMVRGAEDALPSFKRLRSQLPWPANGTTSVEECAEMIVAGLARRSPRIFVPRSAAIVSAVRAAVMSSRLQGPARRKIGKDLDGIDREVAAMRLDAVNSAERST
jgi:NAD(P)-dependent dehydrogenase (short-subunit alcohol dehydrogenase family)